MCWLCKPFKTYRVWIPLIKKTDIVRVVLVMIEMYITERNNVDKNFQNKDENIPESKQVKTRFSKNYTDTYSPVTKLSSIRFVIGMAVEENLILNQTKISMASLVGDIRNTHPETWEKFLLEIIMDESKNEYKSILLQANKILENPVRRRL